MVLIVGLILSYLIGAIPTAFLFGHMLKGIDIRQYGSGNVGATNVFRVLGKGPGILVLLFDIFKGVLVVAVIADILGLVMLWERILMSIMVVIGHNYTVFLKFKGGKGVATSLGVLIGLTLKIAAIRPVLMLTLAVFIVLFLATRIVSISSIITAISLPIFMLATNQPFEIIFLGVIFCVFVVFRHKQNIRRLLAGQEPKVNLFKK